jgi:hypothetical protein
MKSEDKDATIADIHRIREQIAAKFGGDAYAINADARARMEKSGCVVVRREPTAHSATHKSSTE